MSRRSFGFFVAVLAGLASLVMWSRLTPEIVTHWNIRGEPDDWPSRTFVALFLPAMILALTGVLHILPRIDPRGANYGRFQDVYWKVGNGVIALMLVLHVAMLANGAGAEVGVMRVMAGSIGALLILLGNSLARVQPNWFMGIRTPWTLDSPDVWRRTHTLGAWLFGGAGGLTVAAVLIPGSAALTVAFIAVIAAGLASVIASFVFWKQEEQRRAGA
jgi:uncharacterized membrane protein